MQQFIQFLSRISGAMDGTCVDNVQIKKCRLTFKIGDVWGQVIGQCVALTPAPNVAERKLHKAEGDCGFSEPVGGEQPPER